MTKPALPPNDDLARRQRLRIEQRLRGMAEEQLLASEEQFRKIFDEGPIGIVLLDRDLRILRVNHAFATMLDRAPEYLVGESASVGVHPADVGVDDESARRLLDGELPRYQVERRYARPSGAAIWARLSVSAIHDAGGRVQYVLQLVEDVTERKRAQQETELLQRVSLAVAASADLSSALMVVLAEVCAATGWAFGQVWMPNAEGRLALAPAWYAADEGLSHFRHASEGFEFAPAVPLPGAVLVSKRPQWVRDLSREANHARALVAAEVGLSAALATPVLYDESVVAVLEFFAREAREEDEHLLQIVSAVAAQLGALVQRKQIEEALRVSEERFRSVTESARDAIVTTDESGIVLSWNEGARQILGYERDEIIGHALPVLVPPRYQPRHLERFTREVRLPQLAAMGGTVEVHAVRKDGSELPAEVSVSSWESASGLSYTAIIRDVSRRKLAEDALAEAYAELERRVRDEALMRRAAAAVGSAPDLASAFQAFTNVARNVVRFDRATFALVGLHELQVAATTGLTTSRLPVGSSIPLLPGPLLSAIRGQQPHVEGDSSRAHPGSTDDFLFRLGVRSYVAVPIVVAGEVFALVSFGSLQPDAFSPDQARLLETLVREVAGVFNTLLVLKQEREVAQRLRELDQMKNEFVGMVAHDLRNPLAGMALTARLLDRPLSDLTEEEHDELVTLMGRNVSHMLALVEDILHVARIESGQLICEVEPFDFASFVRGTVADVCTGHPGRQCAVSIPGDLPLAVADSQRQRQVLANLLSNAIKFSPHEAPVEVVVEREGDALKVSVRDRGPGIAPEDMPKLFAKFSRIRRDRSIPGTGLGLYIAKSLVEAQGGRIWVESTVGQGTTFSYTVPAARRVW